MSQAEHPDRLRPGREVTVEDVRQLMGATEPAKAVFARELESTLSQRIAEDKASTLPSKPAAPAVQTPATTPAPDRPGG